MTSCIAKSTDLEAYRVSQNFLTKMGIIPWLGGLKGNATKATSPVSSRSSSANSSSYRSSGTDAWASDNPITDDHISRDSSSTGQHSDGTGNGATANSAWPGLSTQSTSACPHIEPPCLCGPASAAGSAPRGHERPTSENFTLCDLRGEPVVRDVIAHWSNGSTTPSAASHAAYSTRSCVEEQKKRHSDTLPHLPSLNFENFSEAMEREIERAMEIVEAELEPINWEEFNFPLPRKTTPVLLTPYQRASWSVVANTAPILATTAATAAAAASLRQTHRREAGQLLDGTQEWTVRQRRQYQEADYNLDSTLQPQGCHRRQDTGISEDMPGSTIHQPLHRTQEAGRSGIITHSPRTRRCMTLCQMRLAPGAAPGRRNPSTSTNSVRYVPFPPDVCSRGDILHLRRRPRRDQYCHRAC